MQSKNWTFDINAGYNVTGNLIKENTLKDDINGHPIDKETNVVIKHFCMIDFVFLCAPLILLTFDFAQYIFILKFFVLRYSQTIQSELEVNKILYMNFKNLSFFSAR